MEKRRVFSGIQPTGNTHLGNYLGAIRNWVAGQEEKINYFCVVDLHSLTVPQDPTELRYQTRSMAAMLLACGIDPEKCTIFIQSHVAAHAEACWLLNCVTPLGWLQRMTQFKVKSATQESADEAARSRIVAICLEATQRAERAHRQRKQRSKPN